MKAEWQHGIFISYVLILNGIRADEMYLRTLPPDVIQAQILTLGLTRRLLKGKENTLCFR